MQGLLALGTTGLILSVFYLKMFLWRRSRCLEQQLQIQQQLMDRVLTEIHNGPLQRLAFLMREVQNREVSQEELLQHLRDVYQDVRADVQNLKSKP